VNKYAPTYLNRGLIEIALQQAIPTAAHGHQRLRVLNLGCGQRPYTELFGSALGQYVGVDVTTGPDVQVSAYGEWLPFADGAFDAVLCVQVLEHVLHPERVVAEIGRVLAPGGMLFLTTHGTFFYHPTPDDYWRWTQAGLRLLFERSGCFGRLDIQPIGGTMSTLALLNGYYMQLALGRLRGRQGINVVTELLRKQVVYNLNRLGPWLDRRFPALSEVSQANTMFLSFLVVAHRNGHGA
jgi:SAM-dependent methyltransferase